MLTGHRANDMEWTHFVLQSFVHQPLPFPATCGHYDRYIAGVYFKNQKTHGIANNQHHDLHEETIGKQACGDMWGFPYKAYRDRSIAAMVTGRERIGLVVQRMISLKLPKATWMKDICFTCFHVSCTTLRTKPMAFSQFDPRSNHYIILLIRSRPHHIARGLYLHDIARCFLGQFASLFGGPAVGWRMTK